MSWTHDRLPEARANGVVTEQIDDEIVVYDLESKDVHCLGPLAAAVYERCDGGSDATRIAESVSERLGRPVTKHEVADAIAQLEQRSLLATPPLVLHDGISRRELARKTAKVGAAVAAVPLITSIVAPTAAMAASPIPSGCGGCGKNSDCISNHCCQGNPGKECQQGCCVQLNNSCHVCDCIGSDCECTVAASDLPGGQCPCLCSDPNCTSEICCTTTVCCTPLPAC